MKHNLYEYRTLEFLVSVQYFLEYTTTNRNIRIHIWIKTYYKKHVACCIGWYLYRNSHCIPWTTWHEFGHDDVIKWKHFPRNWPFVREIHRSPVNFPHKGQWRGALMFSLIYAWINDWVNNREAGDLRRQHGHYDVIVMGDVPVGKIKALRVRLKLKKKSSSIRVTPV